MLSHKPHCLQDPERGPFFLRHQSQVSSLKFFTCDLRLAT
jgi:hypothetical protein